MLTSLLVTAQLLVGPATVAAAPSSPADPPQRDSLSLSLQALDLASDGTVTLDVTDTTIEELFHRLQKSASLPLRIDWTALRRIGVAKDDRLDFHISDVPPLVAVQAIASAMEAEIDRPVVDAFAGQIVVTSPNGLAELRELAVYDIADIIADPTLIDALAVHEAGPVPVPPEAVDEGNPDLKPNPKEDEQKIDEPATQPTTRTVVAESPLSARTERLLEIISEHVDPEGWLDSGGSRGRMTAEAGRIIVTATPKAHRQLRQLLTTIREQAPLSATITCTIAVVPTAALNAALDAALAASGSPKGGDRRAMVQSLRQIQGFRVVSAPRVVTQLGKPAKIELKDETGATLCEATPNFDRARKSFSVAVRVELTSGDRRAAIESTIEGSASGLVDLLRLAGGPTATESFVVLVEAATDPRSQSPSSGNLRPS